jgi:hypothetical protein
MRALLSALLAGSAVIAAAASPARAQNSQIHTLLVQLPSGQIERVEYTGAVAPRIVVAPVALQMMPLAVLPGFDWQPFAALERVSAMMDAQAAAMLRQAATAPATMQASLPAGTAAGQASFVASFSSNGVCSRSMQITYLGDGSKPRMVSHSSGNCGSAAAPSAPAQVNAPAQTPMPRTIEAQTTPVGAPLEQVAWRNQ